MAVKLKSTRVDLTKEREGDWVRSTRFEGVEYLVKSTNNPKYIAALSSDMRRMADAARLSKSEMDVDELHKLRAKLTCEHILLGWKGFDTEYSPELARDELMSLESRPLLDDILAAAELVGRKQVETIEVDAKN